MGSRRPEVRIEAEAQWCAVRKESGRGEGIFLVSLGRLGTFQIYTSALQLRHRDREIKKKKSACCSLLIKREIKRIGKPLIWVVRG